MFHKRGGQLRSRVNYFWTNLKLSQKATASRVDNHIWPNPKLLTQSKAFSTINNFKSQSLLTQKSLLTQSKAFSKSNSFVHESISSDPIQTSFSKFQSFLNNQQLHESITSDQIQSFLSNQSKKLSSQISTAPRVNYFWLNPNILKTELDSAASFVLLRFSCP